MFPYPSPSLATYCKPLMERKEVRFKFQLSTITSFKTMAIHWEGFGKKLFQHD